MGLTKLCILYFYCFTLFMNNGSVVDGNCREADNAIPICTTSQRTGRNIYIDTSAVPTKMTEGQTCRCDVNITSRFENIYLFYKVNGTTSCGIRFDLTYVTFECDIATTNVDDEIHEIVFKKTSSVIQGSVCLLVYIDHKYDDSETNATVNVNCYSSNTDATTISLSSVSTISSPYVSSEKTSLPSVNTISSPSASSERTSTSSTVKSFTRLSTPDTERNTDKTSTNASVTSSSSTTGNVLPRTNVTNPNDSNQTVIIAASAGAGGAFLLLVTIILTVCCYRNRRISRSTLSKKDEFVNTASDHVVTDNVVYNMEFTEDTRQLQVLNDSNTEHSEETNLQVTYKNLQIDEEEGAYNTVSFDAENDRKKIHTPLKNNTFQTDDNGGIYNTVEFDEENTRAENTKYLESYDSQNIASDITYNTLSLENNTNSTTQAHAEHSKPDKESDITYAVIDRGKPSDLKYNRPKQFQVAESGDTYALVSKEAVK